MFRLGKKFFVEGPTPLPPVKGKIFDTRFGLIHVQTGKKNFCRGKPPPLPVKGKIFDTRFGLIHVQTGKKIFCRGTPPQKKLLWLRGGRYASCVHAGGLSCLWKFSHCDLNCTHTNNLALDLSHTSGPGTGPTQVLLKQPLTLKAISVALNKIRGTQSNLTLNQTTSNV